MKWQERHKTACRAPYTIGEVVHACIICNPGMHMLL